MVKERQHRVGCTQDEKELRIFAAMKVVTQHPYKHQQKAALKAMFGVSWRQADSCIKWAFEQIQAMAKSEVEELRAESMNFYKQLATDEEIEPRDRIKAMERFDKVAGVDAPVKLAGHDGGPIKFSLEDALAAIEAAEKKGG